jgi:hypothetical protein
MNEQEIQQEERRACIEIVREYAAMERSGVGPCNAALEALLLRDLRADARVVLNLDEYEEAA